MSSLELVLFVSSHFPMGKSSIVNYLSFKTSKIIRHNCKCLDFQIGKFPRSYPMLTESRNNLADL